MRSKGLMQLEYYSLLTPTVPQTIVTACTHVEQLNMSEVLSKQLQSSAQIAMRMHGAENGKTLAKSFPASAAATVLACHKQRYLDLGNCDPLTLHDDTQSLMRQVFGTQKPRSKDYRRITVNVVRPKAKAQTRSWRAPIVAVRKPIGQCKRGSPRMMYACEARRRAPQHLRRPISYYLSEGWERLPGEEKLRYQTQLERHNNEKSARTVQEVFRATLTREKPTPWGLGDGTSPLRQDSLKTFLDETPEACGPLRGPLHLHAAAMRKDMTEMVDATTVSQHASMKDIEAFFLEQEDRIRDDDRYVWSHQGMIASVGGDDEHIQSALIDCLNNFASRQVSSSEGTIMLLFESRGRLPSNVWFFAALGKKLSARLTSSRRTSCTRRWMLIV